LQALFDQYYGEAIRKAELSGRKVIELRKPVLATDMPMLSSEYWFVPSETAQ